MVLTALLGLVAAGAQKKEDGPQPTVVNPAGPGGIPSDATVLFDGTNLSNWVMSDGAAAEWTLLDGAMACRTGTGDLHSKLRFRNAQIHAVIMFFVSNGRRSPKPRRRRCDDAISNKGVIDIRR